MSTEGRVKGPSSGPSREHAAAMFDKISATYDFLNTLLSFGLDRYWRWRTARRFDPKRHQKILDCATGTGDQLFALLRRSATPPQATGIDPSSNMLEVAREKSLLYPQATNCRFIEGRAHALPFDKHSFDLLTMSFGIRNVESVPLALTEMRRVLKPGGKMLLLEFSLPSFFLFRALHLLYLRHILPVIGKWISGDDTAYTYLAATIETFPYGKDFCRLVKEAGFASCKAHPMTLGIVTLYVAENK
jgi:demethylmenaquinone methyltransferase/2-methoxy-6-polyprenyl-1,4-benzoquinol methylase